MKNKVALILKIIALLIVVIGIAEGLSIGWVELPRYTPNGSGKIGYEMDWIIVTTVWIISFVSGALVLGFAEVIELLQKIVNQTSQK